MKLDYHGDRGIVQPRGRLTPDESVTPRSDSATAPMRCGIVPEWRETRKSTVVNRGDEKAGLRRDAVRSQVIDALEAQEIKETGNEEA